MIIDFIILSMLCDGLTCSVIFTPKASVEFYRVCVSFFRHDTHTYTHTRTSELGYLFLLLSQQIIFTLIEK